MTFSQLRAHARMHLMVVPRRGASFVKKLSFIDEALWGFEVTDADGYVVAFFRLRRDQ